MFYLEEATVLRVLEQIVWRSDEKDRTMERVGVKDLDDNDCESEDTAILYTHFGQRLPLPLSPFHFSSFLSHHRLVGIS